MQANDNNARNPAGPSAAAADDKRSYRAPELQVFGSVQMLTGSISGSGTDTGPQGGMTTVNEELMMWMWSDSRCKENIVPVGRHPLGFGLYLYDYLPGFRTAGQGRQFGVLAQEVEQVRPDAVSLAANGYKRVDYRRLGIFPARAAA